MRPQVIAAMMAGGLLLVGCSDEESGEPSVPGSDSQPTAGGEPTAAGPDVTGGGEQAPSVPDPIGDVEKYREDPCGLISKAEANKLGYPQTESEDDDVTGPTCYWKNDDGSFSFSVSPEDALGLDGPYGQRDTYDYFEPADVAGHPALYSGVTDNRDNGGCALSVGLADDQLITASTSLHMDSPNRDRPCELLKEAAEVAVKTIKSGQ